MSGLYWQAVVAGVGGQGVLFMTRILAGAASARAKSVLISEVHGMAQRGGSVVSHLKAGDFASPLVTLGQADLVLSLEAGEAVRNLPFLAPGSSLVVNAPDDGWLSAEGAGTLAKRKIKVFAADASGLAAAAGAPKGANVVLLAAAAKAGALPFTTEAVWDQIEQSSPPARLKGNRELFQRGLDA